MNRLLSVLAFCALFFSAAFAGCLQGNPTAQPNLVFCTDYKASACCSVDIDALAQETFQTQVAPYFGDDGCAMNFKDVICASACATNQAESSQLVFGSPIKITTYISQNFSSGLYDSCKDRCAFLPTAPGATWGQIYANSTAFLTLLNSENNPNRQPTDPLLSYIQGENPNTAQNIDGDAVEGTGDDLTGCPSQPPTCLDPTNPYATPRALDFCTEYATAGCCTLAQETELKTNFQAKIEPIFGTGGCAQNIKALFCSWVCGPQQAAIASLSLGANGPNQTVYVNSSFAEGLFDSCDDRCFTVPGLKPVTWSAYFATASSPADAFLEYFNSDNDDSYVIDITHPRIFYTTQTNPIGKNSALTAVEGTGADLTGCSNGGSSGTTGSNDNAGVSMAPVFLVTLAAFVAALKL